MDEERGEMAIQKVGISSNLYKGPYLGAGPDLLIGYCRGYRASWAAATGGIEETIFEDNDKAWAASTASTPSWFQA